MLAMKIMDLATEEAARNAYNEHNILETLKHPNIVKFYETFVLKDCLYLIMEYCEQGMLFSNFSSLTGSLSGDLQQKIKEVKSKGEYFSEEQVNS